MPYFRHARTPQPPDRNGTAGIRQGPETAARRRLRLHAVRHCRRQCLFVRMSVPVRETRGFAGSGRTGAENGFSRIGCLSVCQRKTVFARRMHAGRESCAHKEAACVSHRGVWLSF